MGGRVLGRRRIGHGEWTRDEIRSVLRTFDTKDSAYDPEIRGLSVSWMEQDMRFEVGVLSGTFIVDPKLLNIEFGIANIRDHMHPRAPNIARPSGRLGWLPFFGTDHLNVEADLILRTWIAKRARRT